MIKKFKIPIYRGQLIVSIADSLYNAAQNINYKDVEENDDSFAVTMTLFQAEKYHIILPEKSLNRHGTIAHEAKHIVNAVFINKGIRLDTDNDEAECYFLGWVVDRIYEAIEMYKKCKS